MTTTETPQPDTGLLAAPLALPQYEVSADDKVRLQKIADAWQAYHGELPEPLQHTPDGINPNVMTNRCSPIVDGGSSFLFGKEVQIPVEEGAPKQAQTTLDDTWGRVETRIPLLLKLCMNGAMAGSAFLRIVPSMIPGQERAGKKQKFRLVVLDPSITFVQTVPDDVETVLIYCIEFSLMEKDAKGKDVRVFYHEEISRVDPDGNASKGMPDDDDTWTIQHWTKIGDKGAWVPQGEPILWPFAFAPIFNCQNLPLPNSFWGRPDITPDIIGVNKALNLLQSCISLTQLIYGHPILYSNGMGQQDIAMNPGHVLGLPPDGKISSVSITSDVANGLAFAGDLRSDIDEQSGVPGVATGRIKDLPRGALSGITVELLHSSLLKKNERKRCTFGELIIDVSKALLVLNKMSPDINVNLAWQNPLPSDTLEAAQYAIMLKQLGISDATLMRNLGFDPDEEMELSQTEDAQKLQAFSRGQGLPSSVDGTQPAPPAQSQGNSPFLGGNQ